MLLLLKLRNLKMILMIDNFDSFTYNLVQYFLELGEEVKVVRNDEITVEEIKDINPDCIVVSPGPKSPSQAGISVETIQKYTGVLPILGVCLGHQSMGEAFGGKVIKAKKLMHGKTSMIEHDGKGIYEGIENPMQAIRYHSLAVEEATLPDCLEITARAEDGEIMGFRHKENLTVGMQYHPESILSPSGMKLLKNFINMAKKK